MTAATGQDPVPQGKYRPAVRHGDVIYTAGMTPRAAGVLQQTGCIEAGAEPEKYREAVCLATKNALTAASSLLFDGERLVQVLSLTVYINAAAEFTAHSGIADFASVYLEETLGAGGIGARAAVGVSSLPGNAPVEVQIVAAAGLL